MFMLTCCYTCFFWHVHNMSTASGQFCGPDHSWHRGSVLDAEEIPGRPREVKRLWVKRWGTENGIRIKDDQLGFHYPIGMINYKVPLYIGKMGNKKIIKMYTMGWWSTWISLWCIDCPDRWSMDLGWITWSIIFNQPGIVRDWYQLIHLASQGFMTTD